MIPCCDVCGTEENVTLNLEGTREQSWRCPEHPAVRVHPGAHLLTGDDAVTYAGWKPRAEAAEARVKELEDRLPLENRGDGPCDDCGTLANIVWFTPSDIWNVVCRPEGYTSDPILCVTCFVARAEKLDKPTAWVLLPEGVVNRPEAELPALRDAARRFSDADQAIRDLHEEEALSAIPSNAEWAGRVADAWNDQDRALAALRAALTKGNA